MSQKAILWVMDHVAELHKQGDLFEVLLFLADNASPEGTHAFPSVTTLAARLGVSDRTVQRGLRGLYLRGFIEPGDQGYVSRLPLARRPVVWDLCMDGTREKTEAQWELLAGLSGRRRLTNHEVTSCHLCSSADSLCHEVTDCHLRRPSEVTAEVPGGDKGAVVEVTQSCHPNQESNQEYEISAPIPTAAVDAVPCLPVDGGGDGREGRLEPDEASWQRCEPHVGLFDRVVLGWDGTGAKPFHSARDLAALEGWLARRESASSARELGEWEQALLFLASGRSGFDYLDSLTAVINNWERLTARLAASRRPSSHVSAASRVKGLGEPAVASDAAVQGWIMANRVSSDNYVRALRRIRNARATAGTLRAIDLSDLSEEALPATGRGRDEADA